MTLLADGFQVPMSGAGIIVESEKLFLHPKCLQILVVEDRLLKRSPNRPHIVYMVNWNSK